MMDGARLLEQVATLPEVLRLRARETPTHEAVVFGDLRLDYAALDGLVDDCARALVAHGVRAGDRVAMLSTPRWEFLVSLLGAMRMGAIWVGLNPRYTLPEVLHVLDDCRPVLLWSLGRGPDGHDYTPLLDRVAGAAAAPPRLVMIGEGGPAGVARFEAFLATGRDGSGAPVQQVSGGRDPAVIVYTSGSTGRPKGALLAASSFLHSYRAMRESFAGHEALRLGHRVICNLPINHVGCQADVCGNALIDGATLVFMEQFEPARIPAVVEAERVDMLGGLPLMIEAVLAEMEHGEHDVSSLRVIAWGGAPMPRGLLERLAARGYFFSMHYGLTEGGSINSVSRPGSSPEVLCNTIGWPDSDNEYRVLTAEGGQARVGDVGEVQIRGPGVMLGYWGQPEATAAVLGEDGWLRTGDLVEVLPDGAWRMAGRLVERFKSGGYNVYPREVELALETHPAVAAAFVVPAPDPVYDEVGVAFVVPREGAQPSIEALREHCRARLANYKIPKHFELRERVPMLAIGKVDRKALKREAAGWAQSEAARS